MKAKSIAQLALSLALFVIFSCGSKESSDSSARALADDLAGKKIVLKELIAAKPAGIVSSQASLDIEFSRVMIPPHLVGSNLPSKAIEGNIEVTAQWMTQSLIRITPAQALTPGQEIQLTLNGKETFGQQIDVDHYSFQFKVAPQEILSADGSYVPVTGQTNMAQLQVELKFSQKPLLKNLKDDLSLKLGLFSHAFDLKEGSTANSVILTSAPLQRTDEHRILKLNLPSDWTALGKSWEQEYILAAKGSFIVVTHSESPEGNTGLRTWNIRFSDPIAADQDLGSFVQVEPRIPLQVRTNGKNLRVQGNFIPGIAYRLTVISGLPSAYGIKLVQPWSNTIQFQNELPRMAWLSPGSLMPLEHQSRIQFKAININRAQVKVYEVPQQNLIFFLQRNTLSSSQSNSTSDEYEYEYDYGYGSCRGFCDQERVSEVVYHDTLNFSASRNVWHKAELNLSALTHKKPGSVFVVSLNFEQSDLLSRCSDNPNDAGESDLLYVNTTWSTNPCNSGYYWNNGTLQRFAILSSIGLTTKVSSSGLEVWATDLATLKPISGMDLSLYSYSNAILEKKSTNADGRATFSKENGFAVVGESDRGLAVLQLKGSAWELSRFDVGGASAGKDGLRAFIYADRGVHRPGDTIHLGALIRAGRSAPAQGTPLVLQIMNARGQNVFEAKSTSDENGLAAFDVPTNSTDPTGSWSARLQVGGQFFSQVLRVETVKPNRLKVMATLPDVIRGKQQSFNSAYEVRYLFGMPAAQSEIEVNMQITDSPMDFKRYPDFTFRHPEIKMNQIDENAFSGTLNEEGKIQSSIAIPSIAQIPEAAQITLMARVSEQGGDWTEQWQNVRYEPYSAWVGLQSKSADQWLKNKDTLRVPVIALDSKGKPVAGRKLRVRWYVNRRYWWWHYDREGRKDFRTQNETYLAAEKIIESAAHPVVPTWIADEEGAVLMEVQDLKDGHSAGIQFYVSDWGNKAEQGRSKEESWLDVQIDRTVALIGDSVYASFASPENAKALVTLEQAGRVLDSRWITTTAGQTRVGFKLQERDVPNVFVSVSMLQDPFKQNNDQPIRMYGMRNIMVEDPNSRIPLQLKTPTELKPDSDFEITVENPSSKSASFTLAVVDEGLLDLTRFETPDPWKFYFQKLELGVRTVDNYDDVVGALLPQMDALFKLGGDYEMVNRRKNPKARRFPVVALYSGVQQVSAKGHKTVKFRMPHYVGSVRVMLIGATETAFASKEVTLPVKQPLMALLTLPRVVRHGDRFQFPVAVFAMSDQVKQVQVSLIEHKNLIPIGPKMHSIQFDKPGETDVVFELEAKGHEDAKITVLVQSGSFSTKETVALPLEASAPYGTQILDTLLKDGQSHEFSLKDFAIAGTAKNKVVFSRMPVLPIEAIIRDLDQYPYGCLEQTISAAFPLLYLDRFSDIDTRKETAAKRIQSSITKLLQYQTNKYGFSLWPRQSQFGQISADPWATSWAGHFMLEASAMGYSIPPALLKAWENHEVEQAAKAPSGDLRNQAYRLYLLALAGKPATGPMNLLRENFANALDPLSARLLAGAYSLQGKQEIAKNILTGQQGSKAKVGKAPMPTGSRELAGTYGSAMRDIALMTAVAAKTGDTLAVHALAQELVKAWYSDSWHSTQESATALLAAAAMTSTMPSTGDAHFTLITSKGEQKLSTKNKSLSISLPTDGTPFSVQVQNGTLFIQVQQSGIPENPNLPAMRSGIALERMFYNDGGMPITLDQTEPGQPFWVQYRVQSLSKRRIEGLVLSSLFPSGWEIINPRLRDDLPKWMRDKDEPPVTYMDIRDDRVDWFFDLPMESKYEFHMRVMPTFEGDYVMPAVSVEAMYSPQFIARIESGRAVVKPK